MTRRRDRSESSNPGDTVGRRPEEIETVREDGMSRKGQRSDEMTRIEASSATDGHEVNGVDE